MNMADTNAMSASATQCHAVIGCIRCHRKTRRSMTSFTTVGPKDRVRNPSDENACASFARGCLVP